MTYDADGIIRDVKVALDLNMDSTPLTELGDVDTLALDDIIRSKIADAVRRVEISAPVHLLDKGHDFSDAEICWNGDGVGYVPLPSDFMRLVGFRMGDWKRTVFAPILADSAEYAMQSSRFRGIRGNPQKPVCAIVMHAEGIALEFYSCRDEEQAIVHAAYLPQPEIKDNNIEVCADCYRAVVYMAASLVAAATGNADKAAVMSALSETELK